MPRERERVLLAWSGGKDSVMALSALRKAREYETCGLLTVLTGEEERVSAHGVGRELLEAQAQALGLPLVVAHTPRGSCSKTHLGCLRDAVAPFRDSGITKVAFGDLYLDDVRDLREEALEDAGLEAVFPLWQRDTKELSSAFLREKFKAVVTSVDESTLGDRFVGRPYDRSFLADLPLSVDPCGENGEFHTFVYDGPLFKEPISYMLGVKFVEDRFHYCEISVKAPSAPRKRTPVGSP